MRLYNPCVIVTLFLLTAATAYGVEPNAAIKVQTLTRTTTTWAGQPIRYPDGPAEVTGLLIEIAPGAETGWHAHPVPSFAMVLEGTLVVRLKDGREQTVHAGEAVAEVVDTAHNGRNAGEVPVKLVVFYTGTVAQPLTTKP